MENVTGIKLGVTAALATLTALWGWFGWLVLLWLGCLALDFVTGSGVAVKNGQWSSKAARDGIWHKLGSIVAVMVSGAADLLIKTIVDNIPGVTLPFEYMALLCPLVVVWYIITELGSIVENVAGMGAPVPEFLLKALQRTKDVADDVGSLK